MRVLSVVFDKNDYRDLKSLAERTGRPVAELIRQAITEYLNRHRSRRGSIFDVSVHHGGAQLQTWSRQDVFDEMIG
ncbi:MAG: ribbon-helix-helix protein, CopG family [Thermoanaerobaculia bacterium]